MPISLPKKISSEHWFMLSALVVNVGNYAYNLILGRILGPQQFADAAILITLLLVLSFIAMTFQLATAKFSVLFEAEVFSGFINSIYKYASLIGILLGVGIVVTASQFQSVFNTKSHTMFVLFGIGVPLYFIMSVNRGILQGKNRFGKLAFTYQTEMLSRLIITISLLLLFNQNSSVLVASGILISLIFGLFPFAKETINFKKVTAFTQEHSSHIKKFFWLTAFYELSQIIINNSDILLVKHYFEAYEAGLYASLALIGRVVYFVAWMFVMILLPKVVLLHKEGKSTRPVLSKYVLYIGILAFCIVLTCYLFPTTVVQLLFGSAYISIAPLLWKYAIATSLFAISNIFAYYFLSLDVYIPVLLSALLGVTQVVLIVFFHDSLLQVVMVQIYAMATLLTVQLIYFFGFSNTYNTGMSKT